MVASYVKFAQMFSALRISLLSFAVGLLCQSSVVSFHQGRHAAEAISQVPASSQAAVQDLEYTECTFCSVLHVAVDSPAVLLTVSSFLIPDTLEMAISSRRDYRPNLALPGARAPPAPKLYA